MRIFLLLAFILPITVAAQQRDLLSFGLKAAIEKAAPDDEISVYLRGDLDRVTAYVREKNGRVKGIFSDAAAVALPASVFAEISDQEAIRFVEYHAAPGEVLGDQMILNNNIGPVHQGLAPLPEAYTGSDVIIGIIDTGLELAHPDFQHPDGSTRVIALWDQKQAENDPQRVPQPYGYGQEYTAEDIDAGISGHNDQAQFFGHGSTVSGIALGNANATGDFPGVAPEADIIVVSSDFNRQNWTMTVAEAVEWIFARAEAIGKPAVVNASLGSYLGSHDALDAPALHIESLLEASPGRAMVCAAGNSQAWDPYHLGYEIPENDTAFTWFVYNPQALGSGAVFIEAWADAEGFENAEFTVGADVISPAPAFRGYVPWRSAVGNLNQVLTDTLFFNGAIIGIVQTWVGQRGDQYLIQAAVTQPFSSQIRFRFATTGGGRIDAWSSSNIGTSNMVSAGLPTPAEYPPMQQYRLPDKEMTLVDSWACSDKVITVGNYVNRTAFPNAAGGITTYPDLVQGQISVNSGSGPTRDFRQKPEIAASGDVTLSAGRLAYLSTLLNVDPERVSASEMHYVNGGTSMASPVVAGAAALFFERCGSADYADFRTALIETAVADQFTGALPGLRFGHGKLDVFGLILSSIDPIAVSGPDAPICEGETALLTASEGFTDYLWNTGFPGPALNTQETGVFSVEAFDDLACLQKSAPFAVEFEAAPEVPVIIFQDGILAAEGDAAAWQWYLDGSPIPAANGQLFEPSETGWYTVEALSENGCASLSEPFDFSVVSVREAVREGFSVFPNPASDRVFLAAKTALTAVRIFDLTGKNVHAEVLNSSPGQQIELSLPPLDAGVYILSAAGEGGFFTSKLVLDK